MSARKIGMIGGGSRSMIGPIHRSAATVCGTFDLVAGVFSSDHERSLRSADTYGVPANRCYRSPSEMFAAEQRREDGIDTVIIVTPNHLHFAAAVEAISAGIHIVSDKPATATLAEAQDLAAALAASQSSYAITYTYTGFAMVREARARIQDGRIGRVRKVIATYSQGWLATPIERTGHAQATWRTDPARSGPGGSSADIGVHAFNLVEYVSGTRVAAMLADARALVDGRALDDDCNALLRLDNGGSGVLVTSQVAWGEQNGLSIDVYGDAGAVHWSYDRADELRVVDSDGGRATLTPGSAGLLARNSMPYGMSGGVVAPLAAIYRDVATALDGEPGLIGDVVPGIDAAVRGLAFVDAAVRPRRDGWHYFS